jgi:hypothetical protein
MAMGLAETDLIFFDLIFVCCSPRRDLASFLSGAARKKPNTFALVLRPVIRPTH